jgi:hypothetical protein
MVARGQGHVGGQSSDLLQLMSDVLLGGFASTTSLLSIALEAKSSIENLGT